MGSASRQVSREAYVGESMEWAEDSQEMGIYDLFEKYEKMRISSWDFDPADRYGVWLLP